jgi:hypothetical protein
VAGGCLPNYGREPLPPLRLSFSRFACYHDSYHVLSFATPSARLISAAGELDQVAAIRRGGPYPASYQRAAPAQGRTFMRPCRGADDCKNPPPDGGAPGRTFAPEMRGYGRGRELGSAPVQVENRGTAFARKPGISPATGVHFRHIRGSAKPVIPRVSAINPRNPRYPRFFFGGWTRTPESPVPLYLT